MSKLNDYFLNLLYNPEFSPGDFLSVGLNSGNTSIENKEEYKKLDFVQNNPLLLTDGEFDEKKFDRLYEQSLVGYNMLANSGSNKKLATTYSAFRDDIFAKSANRTNLSETFITKIANPNRQSIGFVSNNIKENPKQSVREIALNQLVWDGESNSWIDAPNDTWFDNFINPKVLAQYDEDVDINGKTSSEKGFDKEHLAHKKGDKKINPLTGTYYYETLNGRDIYGRDVLSGWDTLTKDGSWINQYDFFDSDDLKKSDGGSLIKSVVKIAPALIPTTAPWYVGARVILGATDLFAKIGKMAIGSDSPFLSRLEGINKAFTESTSDYSLGSLEMGIESHAWSIENILNLSADVFTQLAELRWMFTHVPSLLKGNKLGFNKEAQEKFKKDLSEKIFNRYKDLSNKEALGPVDRAIKELELKLASMMEAQGILEETLQNSNKFGEHLSKLYMTGITVADSYGEAKEQGLSDIEAALFTLGYAAGEYGILSTNLGEHILPELRAEKHRFKNIARALNEIKGENPTPTTEKEKRKLFQRIVDFGKQTAYGDFNDSKIAEALAKNSTKAFGLSMASNALGEGMEEVSEELWFDIAKSLYNAAAEIGMTSTGATMEAFDGGNLELVMNRYALNFVGGLAGGAIAVGLPGFLDGIKNMLGTNMDKKLAYQELVALIRNGKKDDFLRTVKKMHLNSSDLSATEYEIVDGAVQSKTGTEENNLDKASKTVLEGMVNLIDNLLTINGVKMDDNSILSKLTYAPKFARFLALLGGDTEGSVTLANYLQRFNSLSTRIANLAMEIDAILHPRTDLKGEALQILNLNQENLSNLLAQMNDVIKERDAYLNGDMTKIVVPKILFELSPILSGPYVSTNFKDYAEKVEGKTLSEIPDTRLAELEKSWSDYKNSELKDDLEYAFQNFMAVTQAFSDKLLNFDLSFLQLKSFLLDLGLLFDFTRQEIMTPNNEAEDIQANTQSFELTKGIAQNTRILKSMQALESLIRNAEFDGKEDILKGLLFVKNLPDDVTQITEVFGSHGAINDIKTLAVGIGETFDETSDDANSKLRIIKEDYIKSIISNILYNNSEAVKEVLRKVPYYNREVRDYLKNSFVNLVMFDEYGEYVEFDNEEEFNKRTNLLNEYKNIIDSKPITPIDLLVDLFQLSIGDKSVKMSDLIKVLQDLMTLKANQGVIEEFGYGVDIAEQIKHGLIILDAITSNILGARNDSGRLGAIFGFNSTVNQLNPDIKLAEIDLNSANILMLDLSKLRNILEYFQLIFNVNSGLKLEEQRKIAHRINFAFLNKAKYIVSALPDDWNQPDENGIGVLDKVKATLTKAAVFESMFANKDFNLNLELAKELEKESIVVQDALYELFNLKDNHKRILNGDIDLSILKSLPPVDKEASDYNGTLIDSQLEGFDDRVAVMLLATSASVKASDFYAEYKNSFIDGVAPIPGLELAVKMAYAFLLNKPMFLGFGTAYNNEILEEIKTADSSKYWDMYGKNITKSGKLDNSYALLFLNTFLVEGIPGAGKTTGFLLILYKMLQTYHPELLEDVWFVHTDEEKAKAWAEKLRADTSKAHFFDKHSYLKYIFPNYVPLKTNDLGIITITKEDLVEDEETGISHMKDVEISKTVRKPSLILIDESTRFSQLEMLVSEKFQEENDISAIATGDYDQIGAIGQYKIDDNTTNFLNTAQSNFFHSPKLGSSMRTENTIKDLNIAVARKNKLATIKGLKVGTLGEPLIKLSYYQNDSGLYGERIIGKDSSELDSTITLMLNTLKGEKDSEGNWNGEKVTVLYLDKNSEIYKKLQLIAAGNEEYKGKINFVESSAALGDEGQYYIVDLKTVDINKQTKDNLGNHANFVSTFYTAISRSSQGTLIIENPNVRQIAETSRVMELVKSPLSEESKAKYSKNRLDVLSEIITSELGNTKLNRKSSSKPSTEGEEDSSGGNSTSDEEATELNTKKVKISNDNPKEYNMLIHSMPSLETGFKKDSDGNYIPGENYKLRIDGLNGIVNIANTQITRPDGKEVSLSTQSKRLGLLNGKLKNQEAALSALNSVILAGLYLKDKEEIKKVIKDALGLNLDESEFGVDFLFMFRDTYTEKSNVDAKKSGGFLRMLKSKMESLFGIYRGKNTPSTVEEAGLNKLFALNVYRVVDGERVNILTTPLAVFTNPLTMLLTEGFEKIKAEYEKFKNSTDALLKLINLLKDSSFINTLNASEQGNASKLLKHLTIYTHKSKLDKNNPHSGDAVVYLDGTLAELATTITGPTITVSDSKGKSYYYDHTKNYNGEYTNISDIDKSVHHLTNNIYFSPNDIVVDGKVIVKKGHGFVLATDYYRTLGDDDLFLLFVDKELNSNPEGRISVIYVSSPKIGITDYFKNYALKYRGNSSRNDEIKIDTLIGNELSEFRIAELLAKTDSPFDLYIKQLTSVDTGNKTATLAKWDVFKNIITQLSSDFEKLSSDLKIELLRKPLKDTPYFDLITYDGSDLDIKDAINALKGAYKKGLPLKKFISNTLLNFVLKLSKGYIGEKLEWNSDGSLRITQSILNNIAKVEECLQGAFSEGIFTQIKSKEDSEPIAIKDYTFIQADADNYENNYGKFRINGKIDSTMLVMDVSPVMDLIINTLENLSKKAEQLVWYVKDSRPHTPEEPKPFNIEDIVPKDTLDSFTNKSELINLILNNVKEFENSQTDDSLMLNLIKLGYTVVDSTAGLTLVLIPSGYTLDNDSNEFNYNVVRDSSGKYWILDDKGNLTKPNITFFDSVSDKDMELIKKGPENNTDEELKFLAVVYQQVLEQNKGDKSIEDIEGLMDNIDEMNPDFLNQLGDDIDMDTFKECVRDYIANKKRNGLDDGSFFADLEFNIPENPLPELELLIINIDKLANNYNENNNC